MEFTYRLTGTGWAEATLTDAEMTATIPASYLVDTLRVLLEAVDALVAGAHNSQCSWQVEPGEYRWLFTRSGQTANVRVLGFKNAYVVEPDELGAVVFGASVPITEMAAAFAAGAQAVLDECGEAVYLDRWVEHPFPVDQLDRLHNRLASYPASGK